MMTRAAFEESIRGHLQRKPFKPFVIEFDDGEQWVVGQPEALWYYTGDSALYFRPDGTFDFVDSESVRRFIELTEAPSA
jgi:hypothetical protein